MMDYDHPADKRTADLPNSDARTERTCWFCGERDAQVNKHTFQSEDWPPVAFHDLCAPPLPKLMARFREAFDE